MRSSSPLDKLNSPQRKAVTHGEPVAGGKGVRAGPLLVVAGAGTGKTLTLAHRVAYLAMNGVDPGRILMLTLLAPDIVEAILDGRQAPEMTLPLLMKGFPAEWQDARSLVQRTDATAAFPVR
jgi:hypothetical protein